MIMKKVIIAIGVIALFSFNNKTNNNKEIAYQAIQVQEVLREELFNMYLKEGTIDAESRYIDAKYVESLLQEIIDAK